MADWMCERAVEDGLTVASMKGHTHEFSIDGANTQR